MRWLALAALLAALPASAQMTTARIDTGMLQGKPVYAPASGETGDPPAPLAAYLGIPFAAPPVGANRWRAPQPAAHWQGVRDATRFGADCQQDLVPDRGSIGPWTWEYFPQGPFSEDCLFINVWTPAAEPGAKLPVLLWIYGGGFTGGGTSLPLYDGSALAARGIVVVSVNYRLGIYGFLTHPALTAEAGTSGNYALLDQIAGLEWVHRNIAAFGGDAAKVTISGQSAGAASVHALLASPKAKGLFRYAIAQSGSGLGVIAPPRAMREQVGTRFATAAGVTSLADLRALSPVRIAAVLRDPAMRGTRFGLVQGTPELPDLAHQVSLVPMLTGLTADEASAFGPEYQPIDAAGILTILQQRYGDFAPRFVPLYPARDADTAGASARAMARDRGIAAMLAWGASRPAGSPPVYAYLWTREVPGSQPQYRAYHSAELYYVFDSFAADPRRPFTAEDHAVARRIGDYWANFVKTGSPGGGWAPLGPDARIMELGGAFAMRPALTPEAKAVFDAYAASGGRVGLF